MPKNCSKITVKYPFTHRKNTVQIKRNTLYFSVLRLCFTKKTAKKSCFCLYNGYCSVAELLLHATDDKVYMSNGFEGYADR